MDRSSGRTSVSSSLTFLTLLQDGPVPLAVVDGKGKLTLASQSFEHVTGLAAGSRAPEWVAKLMRGDRSLELHGRRFGSWVKKMLDGHMIVLTDETDLSKAQERAWLREVQLMKVQAERLVRDRMLEHAERRLQTAQSLSPSIEMKLDESRRQKDVAARLRRHVSSEVAEAIAARGDGDLGMHKGTVTILHAEMPALEDLEGDMESEELMEFLAEFQNKMRSLLFEQGGTVESIASVRVRAFFGDPVAHEDHALRAVRAALAMRRDVAAMQKRWFPRVHDCEMRFGIHTGYATLGAVGPPEAEEYTAVGKNVALAMGLERAARPGQILMSSRTYESVKEVIDADALEISLKGSSRPTAAYLAVREKPPVDAQAPAPVVVDQGPRYGHFRVIEKIGEGGMAVVYKAIDEGLGRHVAIKVLSAAQANDEKFVSRFMREARVLAKLNSPHVAQIYFIGAEERPPFFAMELIEGHTLREIIQREGHIPAPRALDMLTQMALGLQAAAEHGIIHRDVKPDNVMVTSKLQVKIMDFGLVKRAGDESGVTAHGIVLGTPRYMSPEQAGCMDVDLRSDIYSAGATFFHMVAGRPPFDGDSALAIMRKHEVAKLPPLSSLPVGVPASVYDLISRMMSKKPQDRHQTYDELLKAIDGCRKSKTGALDFEELKAKIERFRTG